MTTFSCEAAQDTPSRFRVLVNGFADGDGFPTLHDAVNFVAAQGVGGLSFEIYDAFERRFVWTRPRQMDSRSYPGPFSIRANGHPTGLTFASLAEAIASMAVLPRAEEYGVFENEDCVFVKSDPREVRLVEAL